MLDRMDPSRKRAIRLSVALSAAVLLAVALIYTSFTAGRDEVTASQLIAKAKPGTTYILAGTVVDGSVHRTETSLNFSIRDPKSDVVASVHYTGEIPDPFAQGRAVLVDVKEGSSPTATYVGQTNSLTTKCPSKYKAASGAIPKASSHSRSSAT
jgi:cytochrome c-type biogenesis protein CcmE